MIESTLIGIARDALTAHVRGQGYRGPELPEPYTRPRGVFVTLMKHGRLRGCIGHIFPTQTTLAAEIAQLGVMAGTQDDRFPAVTESELSDLDYEISLLTVPEPTTEAQLDARRYGVIVTSGRNRAVLLPDLDGVDSPQHQIEICRRKGRIGPTAPVELQRFEVVKIREEA